MGRARRVQEPFFHCVLQGLPRGLMVDSIPNHVTARTIRHKDSRILQWLVGFRRL